MKKISFGILIGLGITFIMASSLNKTQDIKNSSARVNQVEGLLIFADCKPMKEYEYLGTVKSNTRAFGNTQFEGVRNRLIKKIKSEYPKADGILIRITFISSTLIPRSWYFL